MRVSVGFLGCEVFVELGTLDLSLLRFYQNDDLWSSRLKKIHYIMAIYLVKYQHAASFCVRFIIILSVRTLVGIVALVNAHVKWVEHCSDTENMSFTLGC